MSQDFDFAEYYEGLDPEQIIKYIDQYLTEARPQLTRAEVGELYRDPADDTRFMAWLEDELGEQGDILAESWEENND